jgi:NAD(P)-dependent dehydrogenase (short-subunit alcohol dehydrogenase family)
VAQDVAIVTGCSSGLGQALTGRLTAAGIRVVGVARRPSDDLPAFSGDTNAYVRGNVAEPETVDRAFAAARDLGDLSMVISCAGAGVFGKPGAYSRDDINTVFAGNLIGLILVADRAFADFSQRGSGTIVNVMSTAAHAARPLETVYTAAKWGARGYTDALRAAAKGTKIRVIGVYPGGMRTPFWSAARGTDADGAGFSEPDDIAATIIDALQDRRTAYVTDLLLNRI